VLSTKEAKTFGQPADSWEISAIRRTELFRSVLVFVLVSSKKPRHFGTHGDSA
jgi:hypothetical protein